MCKNRFHRLQLLFWINGCSEKEKYSRPNKPVQRSSSVRKRPLYKKGDLLASEMDAKQLPHEFSTYFRSKEDAMEKPWRIRDEQRRTQRNSQTLMRIWGAGRRRLTAADLLRRVVAVLWTASGWCRGRGRGRRGALRRRRSSSGSRVARGRRRGKGRIRKDLVMPIYKERPISGHEKWGDQNVAIQLPRRLDFWNGY